jgi:Zn-dependent protease/CBS domain-containing protein
LNSSNFRIARVLGIPIEVNATWIITLVFITSILALQFYPEALPRGSPHRDSLALHWIMAVASGIVFFASVLLHELAHSVVAKSQGIPVKAITLFIFGGVSQIGGEARRPLHEFLIAIVGPLMSLLLAGVFFAVIWVSNIDRSEPLAVVLEWLLLMNLVVAAFNMAPGFPLDGGRVLRSLLWGLTGNLLKATRLATATGRAMGYCLMFIGGLAILDLIDFIDPWSALWFGILGMFLESSARQSWFQARALDLLAKHRASEIMSADLTTAEGDEQIQYLIDRGGKRFIYFVTDDDERVSGVLTEKETAPFQVQGRLTVTAADLMLRTEAAVTARPSDDAAAMLQRMEAEGVWHLPVIDEGRVVGVVAKEDILRLLARDLTPGRRLAGQR